MGEINKTDELKHWGVLGMKWGVRRSKKQLTKANDKKKGDIEKDEENFKTTKKKSLSKLTDDEVTKETNRRKLENALQREKVESLRNEVTRIQLEKQYAELNPPKQGFLTKMFNEVWPRAKKATLDAGETLLKDALVSKGKDLLGIDQGDPVDKEWKTADFEYSKSLRKKYNEYEKVRNEARAESDSAKKAALEAKMNQIKDDMDDEITYGGAGKRPKK